MIHPANLPFCVYCGSPRECTDHVLPRKHRRNPNANDSMRFVVACCKLCNSRAGGRLYNTFEAKRDALFSIAEKEGRAQPQNLPAMTQVVGDYLYEKTASDQVRRTLDYRRGKDDEIDFIYYTPSGPRGSVDDYVNFLANRTKK